jgi:hypothetical protein
VLIGDTLCILLHCAPLGAFPVRYLCRYGDRFFLNLAFIGAIQVLVALRKNLEGATFANGARVRVREVDFSTLSLEEQIYVDATTDVMIGPHGAGLMHNVFMPDRAALIELFVDGSAANRHFHNLAFWRGHDYQGESQNNPLNVGNVVRLARSAVGRLDLAEPPW